MVSFSRSIDHMDGSDPQCIANGCTVQDVKRKLILRGDKVDDKLKAAKGIVIGIVISSIIWAFILFIMFL